MKLSDLMLDVATGDASQYDVEMAAAGGRIDVSNAFFEAAYKISELPEDNDNFAIIQEAADAGLPTDRAGATSLACTSAKKTLDAFFDLVLSAAKNVKQAADKDLRIIRTVGRQMGVTADTQSNFVTSFAVPLGKTIVDRAGNGKRVELTQKRFLKGKTALKMATSYGRGMVNFLAGYGISIANVFSDPTIAVEFDKSCQTKKGEPTSLKMINSYLSTGGSAINMDSQVDRSGHYTNSPKADDIRDLAIALYVLIAVSNATISACAKGAKSTAMTKINELCNDDTGNNRKITRSIEAISVDSKKWRSDLTNLTENVKKAFTDSATLLKTDIEK